MDLFHAQLLPEIRDLVRAAAASDGASRGALARTCRTAARETLRWHAAHVARGCQLAMARPYAIARIYGTGLFRSAPPQFTFALLDAKGAALGHWQHVVHSGGGRGVTFDEQDLLHAYIGLPDPLGKAGWSPWALDYLRERQAARAAATCVLSAVQ